MDRARRAGITALAIVVALGLAGVPAGQPWAARAALAAAVAWPVSTLVVSEVQTGGASASDEFVEIANQGAGPVDLIGLELVYATSSGSTVTRKATWSGSFVLSTGQRFLAVNAVGSLAAIGDATYSGGFAATGGAVALRVVGGSVVDAIGWGDATNAFVEGTVAAAPPAGSSLERRPGGASGNGIDTNDNAIDWFVSPTPGPQRSIDPPVPDPGSEPSPTPVPTVSPEPTPEPTPVPTPEPTATPIPTVSPEPTPEPTPVPTPEPTATPEPTPTPTTAPIAIATVRELADGSSATVTGVLTTDLGALESGRTTFIQDETAGIALYLDAPVVVGLPSGTAVTVTGTVDDRYAQRTLRIAELSVVVVGQPGLPGSVAVSTGTLGEGIEGQRLTIMGAVIGGADVLADGVAVSIDDGSGAARVVVTPAALAGQDLASGAVVTATGSLGQRDSSGTGSTGYRLYVTMSADLTIQPAPTPQPTSTPTPSPDPTPTPTPEPTSTPTPAPAQTPTPDPTTTPDPSRTPSPTATPSTMTIAAARIHPVGTIVTVRGVITAEAGRLGTPTLLAIADSTGGIVVKLPPDIVPAPARGRVILVRGPLADPYGQLEIRPAAAGLEVEGTGDLPAPIDLGASSPSDATEARLVRIDGVVVVRPAKATSGDIALAIETSSGTRIRVMADASSGATTTAFPMGARYRITGIAGQRATKKGLPDGFRIWLRDTNDVFLIAPAPTASPGSSAAPTMTPAPSKSPKPSGGTSSPATVSVANAIRTTDRDVAIEAVVTAPVTLLDASGRRIVVQDATGAIEILLPKVGRAPGIGTRIRAIGRVGKAYGAPRLRASSIDIRGSGSVPPALRVNGALTDAHTWRLVSIAGRIDDVRKLGDRWRAEIVVGAQRLVVIGQPGAGIPMARLIEGRSAEIVGIVRPAYPSASDRRAAVLPRSAADVRVAAGSSAMAGSSPGSGGTRSTSAGGNVANGGTAAADGPQASSMTGSLVPDADLVDLASVLRTTVRVGGLVVDLRPDGFTLDDGTAAGLVVLRGPAGASLALIEPGDAINVIGRVEHVDTGELAVVVDDPGAITLGSDLGEAADIDPAGAPSPVIVAVEDPSDPRVAHLGGGLGEVPGAGAGVLGLLTISLVSIGATALRRRHARRLMDTRVALRLAAIAGPAAPAMD